MQARLARYRLFWALRRRRVRIVLIVLLLTVLLTAPVAERYGDKLQIALPLLGLGCTVLTGGTGEYLLRFVAMEAVVHGSKNTLGRTEINLRPNGGGQGFPSGHTAAAVFGASYLVHDCLEASMPAKAAVIIAAGFTGASRIEAGKHTIWQVLAGVLVGWLCERLFRTRPRRFLRWIKDRRMMAADQGNLRGDRHGGEEAPHARTPQPPPQPPR